MNSKLSRITIVVLITAIVVYLLSPKISEAVNNAGGGVMSAIDQIDLSGRIQDVAIGIIITAASILFFTLFSGVIVATIAAIGIAIGLLFIVKSLSSRKKNIVINSDKNEK